MLLQISIFSGRLLVLNLLQDLSDSFHRLGHGLRLVHRFISECLPASRIVASLSMDAKSFQLKGVMSMGDFRKLTCEYQPVWLAASL
ncbi:unnamed protein product [Fusarium graminearum]|nr:unnamed protein product [Fusarium graminearum]